MSGPNINVSNGTCYTAAGKKLDGSFIPCGNEAFGYQTCCGAGDNCLADLACFGIHGSGYGSYLTYFAGCTDSSYKDASCPNKQVDQPWVALTLCDNSDGAWAICSQQGNPSTLQPGSFCSCTSSASATVAFKDANTLANIAALPKGTGQSISFFAGHSPNPSATPTGSGAPKGSSSGGSSSSAPKSSSAVSTSTLPGGSITTVFSIIPSSSSGSQSSSSGSSKKLGTGAIVGIAIGALVAVLLLIILAILLLRRRQRSAPSEIGNAESPDFKEPKLSKLSKQRESDMSTAPSVLVRPTTPTMPEADGRPLSEVMGRPAEPWTLRSELEGKQVIPRKQVAPGNVTGDASREESVALPAVAELPGSEPEPRRDTAAGPVEEAMVAPLRLHPRNEETGQVLSNNEGSSPRR